MRQRKCEGRRRVKGRVIGHQIRRVLELVACLFHASSKAKEVLGSTTRGMLFLLLSTRTEPNLPMGCQTPHCSATQSISCLLQLKHIGA